MSQATGIKIAADIGRTFTNVVVTELRSGAAALKLPSTLPNYERAVVDAMDLLWADGLDPESVTAVCHGTTVATNAVREGRGARTALITTRGFRGVLELPENPGTPALRPVF